MQPKPSTIQVPAVFRRLWEPHRYKVLYGGRGGMKSYAIADYLLVQGAQQFERVICAREHMNSLAESVHHLLEQRISALDLNRFYEVQKATILGPKWKDGQRTEFIFFGLKHDVESIKSTEGATKIWCEEAATVSDNSWKVVIPTMRWEDPASGRASEILISFNPKLSTDSTYKRFILNTPPDCLKIQTSYLDNPFLPEVLRIEAEHLKETDPAAYAHIWLGECQSAVEGAIFAAETKEAEEEHRIGSFPIDRSRPVDTFWDLGFGDLTAVWFAQHVNGWWHIVDYMEGSGKTIADYMVMLQNRQYLYGTDWLPHDAVDTIIHAKLGGDKTRSIEQLMRAAGRNVRIAPKLYVTDRINAARTIFGQCRFNSALCADGIQALRHYQWGPPNSQGEARSKPLHNWASHGADSFCTFAVSAKAPAKAVAMRAREPEGEYSWLS